MSGRLSAQNFHENFSLAVRLVIWYTGLPYRTPEPAARYCGKLIFETPDDTLRGLAALFSPPFTVYIFDKYIERYTRTFSISLAMATADRFISAGPIADE